MSGSEDYIYSQRIQTLSQNGGLREVLISESDMQQLKNNDSKGRGMRVNNMIFSPTKMKSLAITNFKGNNHIMNSPQGENDVLNPFKQHTLNSNNKSPFKTMVKQQPIEADASVVPMETETNVKEEDEESLPETKPFTLFQSVQKKILIELQQESLFKIRTQGASPSEAARLLEPCDECRKASSLHNYNRLSDPGKLRMIVIDCRLEMLIAEATLPRTCKVGIDNITSKQ